jgi:yeast amino acid transporter
VSLVANDRRLQHAKLYGNVSEAQAAYYDRDNELYPYKSHGQWLKALYGMVVCIIVLLFNGVGAFLERPFDVGAFLSAYIGIPVFVLLVLGYKVRRHGLRFWEYGLERSGDLSNTVQAASTKRKGRLQFEPGGWTRQNIDLFFDWIWVWIK